MGEIGGEIGKDRVPGGLLKTGQATQYGGYLDDGYYEKGLSKRYTILTLGQYALTTGITLNAKTDAHSNNCVYDQRTKLMWSRYVSGSVGPGSNGKLPWTTNVNGEGIFPYAEAANAALLAGYSDWRVPNDFELASLRVMEAPSSMPDASAFPGWPSGSYSWSATMCPGYPDRPMFMHNSLGSIEYAHWSGNYVVALVRGG